jgi:hypothetical protein
LLALHPAEVCDLVYSLCAPTDGEARERFDRELASPGWTAASERVRYAIEAGL